MAPVLPTLSGELDIQQAQSQREALLAIVTAHLQAGDGADLQLDLSGIGHCDSAGVQLLLAARQTLRPSGARLYIGPASAVVRDVLQTYGLGSLLAQPVMNDTPA